jgi:hypothetical protein
LQSAALSVQHSLNLVARRRGEALLLLLLLLQAAAIAAAAENKSLGVHVDITPQPTS